MADKTDIIMQLVTCLTRLFDTAIQLIYTLYGITSDSQCDSSKTQRLIKLCSAVPCIGLIPLTHARF